MIAKWSRTVDTASTFSSNSTAARKLPEALPVLPEAEKMSQKHLLRKDIPKTRFNFDTTMFEHCLPKYNYKR